jgi:hypothetical protein
MDELLAPFAYAEKQNEILSWLFFFRKILFRLKNKLKSTDYKPAEHCSFSWKRSFVHGEYEPLGSRLLYSGLWFAPYFYTKDQKECKQTKQHDT